MAGLDAHADHTFSGQAVRLWLDAFTGTTWRTQGGGLSHPEIEFATSTAILAWRWGGQDREDPYLEPFVHGALLDPDLETRRDLLWQATVGLGGGLW